MDLGRTYRTKLKQMCKGAEMSRFRTIKKYQNGWVIRLFNQDHLDLNFKDGDKVDIEDLIVHRKLTKLNSKDLINQVKEEIEESKLNKEEKPCQK